MEKICVVCRSSDRPHDVAGVEAVARRLSSLLRGEIAPTLQDFGETDGMFVIPTFSLIRQHNHPDLPANRFLGGLVDHEFMTTKLITHPAWDHEDGLPLGWKTQFAEDLRDCVLPGFSVFSHAHAMNAGAFLLKTRRIRLKDPYASGGNGQRVIETGLQLERFLETFSTNDMTKGIVIEEDIENATTYSVGQVSVGSLTATYVGRQYTTRDLKGDTVYAGSRLHVVRGGWTQLLQRLRAPTARRIVDSAMRYDKAAECHLGLVSSRKNYDVLVGPITENGFCFGVLEQSWRVGGATPAEILALEKMTEDDSVTALQATTREKYGPAPQLRDEDFVVFSGEDAAGQPLHKYARIEKLYHDP